MIDYIEERLERKGTNTQSVCFLKSGKTAFAVKRRKTIRDCQVSRGAVPWSVNLCKMRWIVS